MAIEYAFVCPLPNGIHARPASLLEEAAQTRLQLFGYHLPFPGLYQITRAASGFEAVLTEPPPSE